MSFCSGRKTKYHRSKDMCMFVLTRTSRRHNRRHCVVYYWSCWYGNSCSGCCHNRGGWHRLCDVVCLWYLRCDLYRGFIKIRDLVHWRQSAGGDVMRVWWKKKWRKWENGIAFIAFMYCICLIYLLICYNSVENDTLTNVIWFSNGLEFLFVSLISFLWPSNL